jgi:rRNA maturation endonuclease Nob1
VKLQKELQAIEETRRTYIYLILALVSSVILVALFKGVLPRVQKSGGKGAMPREAVTERVSKKALHCSSCGKGPYPPESKFCPGCGADLSSHMGKFCVITGQALGEDPGKFCRFCGQELATATRGADGRGEWS